MLMMLDVADALPLILERSDRRTELQIPTMLALLCARRSLWRRRDGYPQRIYANGNGRNHGVGRGVDDRDGVGDLIGHVGSGSVRRDRYPTTTYANRNGRNHGIARGVDDRDADREATRQGDRGAHTGSHAIRRS